MRSITREPANYITKALAALVVMACGQPPVVASSRGNLEHGITLKAAIEKAVTHNWDLLAARNNIDLNRAQEMIAKEFPNPTLKNGVIKAYAKVLQEEAIVVILKESEETRPNVKGP